MDFLRVSEQTTTLILGYSATFVSTIASMPLLYKSCNHDKALEQLSKKTLMIGALAHGLWFGYAYLILDNPLLVCSLITFCIESTLLILKTKRSVLKHDRKTNSYKHRSTQTEICYVNTKQAHL